jgi:hypothetical protein
VPTEEKVIKEDLINKITMQIKRKVLVRIPLH